MEERLIPLPYGVSRINQRLRARMRMYERDQTRPLEIPDYTYNWVLLEQGMDVYWDGIIPELHNNIRDNRLDIVRVLAKSSYLRGKEISLEANVNPETVRILIGIQMEVTVSDQVVRAEIGNVRVIIEIGVKV